MSLVNLTCDPETTLSYTINQDEIKSFLKEIPDGWNIIDGELTKTFHLSSFMNAVKFMYKLAELAEEFDHHPRMNLDWNSVTFFISTHRTRVSKIAGFTKCDFIFAAKADLFSKEF